MPTINKYIILDEMNKKYYDNNPNTRFYSDKINNAWVFGDEKLEYQTVLLKRNGLMYEVILKVNGNGTLTKVR